MADDRGVAAGAGSFRQAEENPQFRQMTKRIRSEQAQMRFAQAYEAAVQPQRADRSRDLLGGSLDAPLFQGIVSRPNPRPWAEASPTRNVVGYSKTDVALPASWSPEERARLQRRLVNAGILDPSKARYGMWDPSTEAAYTELLTFASQAGMTQLEALQEYQQAKTWAAEQGVPWTTFGGAAASGQDPAGGRFAAPRYQAPDPASIAQAVKTIYKEQLGREPSEQEKEDLATHLLEVDRDAFADAAAQAAGPMAGAADVGVFDESTALWGASDPAGVDGEMEPAVDPEARSAQAVDEFFQSRYASEIAGNEDRAEQVELAAPAQGLFNAVGEAI